jgi:hypothetical protein
MAAALLRLLRHYFTTAVPHRHSFTTLLQHNGFTTTALLLAAPDERNGMAAALLRIRRHSVHA